jgi:hypothetical protein
MSAMILGLFIQVFGVDYIEINVFQTLPPGGS